MTRREASEIVGAYFESWYSFVLRYAWRATGNLQLAEDLVQDVFVRLYLQLRKENPIRNPKAWTLAVLRREITKAAHKEATGPRLISLGTLDSEVIEQPPSTESFTDSDDFTKLLSVLSRREEEVILLRVAGLKYREIARELGFSVNSVSTLLTRALQKLRKAADSGLKEGSIGNGVAKNALRTLQ